MKAISLSLSPVLACIGLPFFACTGGIFCLPGELIFAAATVAIGTPGHLGQRCRDIYASAA